MLFMKCFSNLPSSETIAKYSRKLFIRVSVSNSKKIKKQRQRRKDLRFQGITTKGTLYKRLPKDVRIWKATWEPQFRKTLP